MPAGIRFILALEGQKVPKGQRVLISPSRKGIILDRRLAPNAETFAAVDRARREDACRGFKGVPDEASVVVAPPSAAAGSNPPSPG